MPLLELSCVNCSAPLQIAGDLERFACSYCGTSQIVERSGGIVALKKVQASISAVQRGTDRTAAELAIPRLSKELAEAQQARANGVKAAKSKIESAKRGRRHLVVIAILVLFFGGVGMLGSIAPEVTLFKQRILIALWLAVVIGVPAFIFVKVKMPPDESPEVLAAHDAVIRKIQSQIDANRAILDS